MWREVAESGLPYHPAYGWGNMRLSCMFCVLGYVGDLTLEPIVGIGSVCRLQQTDEAARIIETIWSMGIRLHGFGFLSPNQHLSG